MGKNNVAKFLIVFGFLLVMLGFNKYGSQFLTTSILGNKLINKVDYNLYKYSSDGNTLKVVGNYILDISEEVNEFSYRGNIIDLKGNLIFEGVFGKNIIQGIDGNLYYFPLDLDPESRFLYRLKDGVSEQVTDKPIKSYITFNKRLNDFENEDVLSHINNNILYGYYIGDDENNGEMYYLENESFKKLNVSGKYIDSVPTMINNELNYKYIIIKNNNDKYGIYDLIAKKYIVENSYSKITSLKNNMFIACVPREDSPRNNCGVIDLYENVLLDFKYDEILVDNYNNNYVMAKSNGRYDLYDSSLNKLVSFSYDLNENHDYIIRKLDNNFIIYNASMIKSKNYKVILLKKDGYFKIIDSNKLFIYDNLLVSYDIQSNTISGYDYNFKEIYNIKNEGDLDSFKISKPVIRVNNKIYNTYTGETVSKDTNYVEVVGNGVKLYHSPNKLFLMINDEKYSVTSSDAEPFDYFVSKTDDGYYFVANYISNYTFVYLEKN